ncbi:MAG TPA: Coenzyme F420 hydrogenase/dehydrogenase, beta subunit C-terminal domain [Sphingobium sp.]|nr:Coenzyme F420 hydrogenase/dehydrogenase, beta subunit C-terminal domain [Sphingobium sp.]
MTKPVAPREMLRAGLCTGCGTCAALAVRDEVRLDWDRDGQLKPVGPPAWTHRPDERFARLCPFSPLADNEDVLATARFPDSRHDPWIGRFQAAYVGHAAEQDYRERGSSGGMVSWVAAELLKRGLVDGVAHVGRADPAADGRLFRYRISRDIAALKDGAQSRYYPVDMAQILREMREIPGRYAVVGIPCFIKAVHLTRAADPVLRDRIAFTLGLVCGHMKSRDMVESFAWQMDVDIRAVAKVDYRVKDESRPANWYTARLTCRDGQQHQRDWWHLVDGDWGSGFFQNRACDFCDDVVADTADIAFGDAWVEPYSSDGRGTNVVVVRSPLLHAMLHDAIEEGRLSLQEVAADFVRQTQAAGFRQRREGLAYRLAWLSPGLRPRKRVEAGGRLGWRRKLIYRLRHYISRMSSTAFRLSKALGRPGLFLLWGRSILALYHGLTYSRGRLGRMFDRAERVWK